MTVSALRNPVGSGNSGVPMPTLYDLINVPSSKMSMRYAGMLTTTRVSVGTAFGPGSISGLGAAVATALVGSADGAGVGVDALRLLFGSTTQPETRNTDKNKMSRDRFIFIDSFHLAGATSVPRLNFGKSVFLCVF